MISEKYLELIGKKNTIPGYFSKQVIIEAIDPLGSAILLRVRTLEGKPDEIVISEDEFEKLIEEISKKREEQIQVPSNFLRLLIESNRISFSLYL